jgi:hypothetical protein
MMVFHSHENNTGEKDQVRPSECAEGEVLRNKSGGRHQENAEPHSEKPNQTDVVRGFSFDDPHDERNIKKRQKNARPRTDLIENIHNIFSWHFDPIDSRGWFGTVVSGS